MSCTLSSLLLPAIQAADGGLPVFPVSPGAEGPPLWSDWRNNAVTQTELVYTAWGMHKDANIGIRCGTGVMVIRTRSDDDAFRIHLWLAEPTVTSKTPWGYDFFVRLEQSVMPRARFGLEMVGWGEYVLAPGSIIHGEVAYTWDIPPWEATVIAMPRWMLATGDA